MDNEIVHIEQRWCVVFSSGVITCHSKEEALELLATVNFVDGKQWTPKQIAEMHSARNEAGRR